jgi:hypothetical protein
VARIAFSARKATYAGDSGVLRCPVEPQTEKPSIGPSSLAASKYCDMPAVNSAGVPIYYEVIETGAPILFLHGVLSSFEDNWRQSGGVDFLLAQDRQVVGMDCRGHRQQLEIAGGSVDQKATAAAVHQQR